MNREFEYRLNKLYTHPLLGDLLDNGDIDYAILDILEGLLKMKNTVISIETVYARQEFLKFPVIRAFLDLNLLFKSKYYDYVTVEHLYYLEAVERHVRARKARMNKYEQMRYRLFRKVKGVPFGSKFSGVPLKTNLMEKKGIFPKKSY